MSGESKHKTDKWYVGGNGRDILVFDDRLDRGQLIATVASYVYSERHTSQGPETALLIAAAPDLLEALIELNDIVKRNGLAHSKRASIAIAKATGEAK